VVTTTTTYTTTTTFGPVGPASAGYGILTLFIGSILGFETLKRALPTSIATKNLVRIPDWLFAGAS